MTLQWENGRHRIISDSSQKVFSLGDKFGIATYGDAFIGTRTISGLMDEFLASLGDDTPAEVEGLTERLAGFFRDRFTTDAPAELLEWCEEHPGWFRLGFLVAGYDADGVGCLYEAGVPGEEVSAVGDPDRPITTAAIGACWRGQTDVVRRLMKGVDWDAFLELGYDFPPELHEPIGELEYVIHFPVTMQDAVDYATFIIRTTIDMQRFSDGIFGRPEGVPGCGGPVRVLSVTRDGTEWVSAPSVTADRRPGMAEEGQA
jgi:hypothetical protein